MELESESTTVEDWNFGAADSDEFLQFCDICHFRKSETVILSGHEKVLFGKLLSIVCTTTPCHYHPKTSCIPCLKKLHHLKEYLREILLNALRIRRKTHVRTTTSTTMQDEEERQAPTTTTKPSGEQHQDKKEKHFESYTCQCSDCRIKFGGLALLVDVIERREKKTCPEEQEKTETKKEGMRGVEKEEEEARPSTSRKSPSFSRSSLETELETPCEEPSSSSQTASHATQKELRSTKIRQMRCQHCGKTFTHKGDLNKHLRKHTGEQPFACPVCQRRFAHTSNLSRHVRLHSGHRPYACDVCNKRFSRKDKLDLHKRSKYCRKSSK